MNNDSAPTAYWQRRILTSTIVGHALAGAARLTVWIPDTPESFGLPPIEETAHTPPSTFGYLQINWRGKQTLQTDCELAR